MAKNHLKRLSSPRTWPLGKREGVFVARSRPGAHKFEDQIPLSVVLRDMAGVVGTAKEARFILHNKDCFVDGKVIHDIRSGVGIFDTVSVKSIGAYYRMAITRRNNLVLLKIDEKEAAKKICQITGKHSLKGGITQYTTFDGRCIRAEKDVSLNIGDSVEISLPDQKVLHTYALKEGAPVFLYKGSHVGESGIVESIDGSLITIKTDHGTFKTHKEYAVVIGEKKPQITVERS